MLVSNSRDQEDGPWGDPFLLVRLWIHARKRINLICALTQDTRVSEWKREFIPCGYSFTTYFMQISIARERSIKMNKMWSLLLRCSHLWRRQSWTQVTTVYVKVENRELIAGPLPIQDALSGSMARGLLAWNMVCSQI